MTQRTTLNSLRQAAPHLTVTIDAKNRPSNGVPMGVTQLQNHLLDILRHWQAKGIATPDIAVIDGTQTNNRTEDPFVQRQHALELAAEHFTHHSAQTPTPHEELLSKIMAAHVNALNQNPKIASLIADNQITGESRGFAEELLQQYGGVYLDDDGEHMGFTVKRLIDIMGVLGYQHKAKIDPDMPTDRKQTKLTDLLRQFADVVADQGVAESSMSDAFDTIHLLFDQEIERRREAEIEVERLRSALYGIKGSELPPARGQAPAKGSPQALAEQVGLPCFMTKVTPGYERLYHYLVLALNQAQSGKGAERHSSANSLAFDKQRMQSISHLIKSPAGMVFQACKKLTEGMEMDTYERQERELLGVINYIAGILIYLSDTQPTVDPDDL